jgi:hypothetical protein
MVKTIRLGLFVCAGLFAWAALNAQDAAPSGAPTATKAATDGVGASAAADAATTPADSAAAGGKGAAGTIVVPSGTRLPLVLHNSITTRNAQPGDPIYLETTFPIVQDERVLVPAGSYVQGEITDAKRPGKVKGTGELRVRLTTMILPNGYTVKFGAVPTNAGTGGNESTDKEGTIHGDTDKSSDVGTVMKGTGAGAGIGAIATRSATGAGIGAGIGAAVGLATVLMTRGPELELPRGTSVDIVLDRPLYLDGSKINFTEPGRAPELAGPPSREPTRTRMPF